MKVLYIGNYYDGSGWSNHCIGNILALDAVGITVIPRPIRLNNNPVGIHQRIWELEQNNSDGITHVVQHTLPHLFEYKSGVKNIGVVNIEGSNVNRIGWAKYCNLMDQMIVPCPHNKKALEDSGVRVPIDIVPAAVDIDKFSKEYPFPPNLKVALEGKYVFYYVGDWSARKGLDKLVRAFYAEFGRHEPVELLLKINVRADNPQETIHNWLSEVKRGLRLHEDINNYKPTIVITDRLTDEQIYGLHQNLNAYVCTSYGEAINLPLLDSLGFGRQVVSSRHSGLGYYLSEDVGYCVDWREEPCIGAFDTIPDLYTSEENWYEVSVSSLMKKMRAAFQDSVSEKERRIRRGREDVMEFSYEHVGEIMRGVLDGF